MTKPLTPHNVCRPHKGIRERKLWAKYIQIPQKNSLYRGRFNLPDLVSTLLLLTMLCAIYSLWVMYKGPFLLYFLMFSDTLFHKELVFL